MRDEELLRYSRQILLPGIDVSGQERLLDATVLILGLGGHGSAASMYLAAAGVGHLVLVDDDRVDLANLQRQIAHATPDLGRLKVDSARERLRTLNPGCRVTPVSNRLSEPTLAEAVSQAAVVVDASDNFPTRFALNRACLKAKRPLVSGAAIRFEGQLSVFDSARGESPCYACLYDEEGPEAEGCVEAGVIAPLVGIIGSLQALEAIKLLTGAGRPLIGRLLHLDGLTMEWRVSTLKRDPDCSTCSALGASH